MQTITDNIANVQSVFSEVKNLEKLIDEVKHIADQTKLLSLNAAIEAARAGEAGRGFAVVADEVHKLSSQSHATAEKMNKMIMGLIESIEKRLKNIMAEATKQQWEKAFETIKNQLNQLFEVNEKTNSICSQTMGKMQEQTSLAADMIMEALSSIQFQDIIRQKTENIQQLLNEVNDYFNNLTEAIGTQEPSEIAALPMPSADQLKKKYKMAAERKTHAYATGESYSLDEDDGPSIELF
nr:methyl-accepting chemotaxis protein [Desulfovulcanus ferrireducens]